MSIGSPRSQVTSSTVTFCDFLGYYHKLFPDNTLKASEQLNDITFTQKKRSILHQISTNQHVHLAQHLLNSYLIIDVEAVDSNNVSTLTMLIMNLCLNEAIEGSNDKRIDLI
jgi:hypothetical protein